MCDRVLSINYQITSIDQPINQSIKGRLMEECMFHAPRCRVCPGIQPPFEVITADIRTSVRSVERELRLVRDEPDTGRRERARDKSDSSGYGWSLAAPGWAGKG